MSFLSAFSNDAILVGDLRTGDGSSSPRQLDSAIEFHARLIRNGFIKFGMTCLKILLYLSHFYHFYIFSMLHPSWLVLPPNSYFCRFLVFFYTPYDIKS